MIIGKIKLFEKRIIGDNPHNGPLLVRWILFRVPGFGIFLHKLCRSDHDRALHDHPWPFVSIVLRGYDEIRHIKDVENVGMQETISVTEYQKHRFGSILYRPATWRHRVIIGNKPAWTLVLVGLNFRHWGFWPNGEFCWWRKYNYDKGICEENPIHPEQTE